MSENGGASATPTPHIGRASVLMASGTIVSRVLGFVKAAVLALTIGQVGSAAGDAFGAANQLPNNIYALIAGGVLGAVLVPQIVRAGLHDDGGQRFINKLVTLGVTIFIGVTIVATLCAPLLIALYTQRSDGFTESGVALATAFAYWCLPQILFYALYSLLGEVLNARNAFGPFTWAPVLNNVVAILGLVAFLLLFGGASENSSPDVWTSEKIALLAGSATLGIAAQALVLWAFWKRVGLTFRPDFQWRGVGLGRTGRTAGWVFAMILVTQLAGIVQSRVAFLAAGEGAAVLALQNSWLIFMLPHSVIAVSIATAYFTRMSGHASNGRLTELRADVSQSLRSIGMLMVFGAIALAVIAHPFARFFETEFGNVQAMALVIIAFVVGLVPFSAVFVLQRVFYSLEDTRTPFFIEVIKSTLFVAGALACSILPTEWIGAGLALVTALVATAHFLITFVWLRVRLGPLDGRLLLRRHLEYGLAAIPAGAAGFGLLVILGGLTDGGFAVASFLGAVASIAVIGVAMAAVYFGVLAVFKHPELTPALRPLLARLRRG
ncbi:MAG TPA: murein biosynthesis integral membrane protein MurJ [Terrimesophilobacter sp.]|nr:murein biosynthesis integral membrane protein MurJ [Terrimesophilobacter sp.]